MFHPRSTVCLSYSKLASNCCAANLLKSQEYRRKPQLLKTTRVCTSWLSGELKPKRQNINPLSRPFLRLIGVIAIKSPDNGAPEETIEWEHTANCFYPECTTHVLKNESNEKKKTEVVACCSSFPNLRPLWEEDCTQPCLGGECVCRKPATKRKKP